MNLEVKNNPFFHWKNRRFHTIILLMAGLSCITYTRMSLGVTMTCLVNTTAVDIATSKLSNVSKLLPPPECIASKPISNLSDVPVDLNDYGGRLLWDRSIQNLIFGGAFIGSLFSILPAGYLADRTSPKAIMLIATLLYSTALFFPFLANNTSYQVVFISRLLIGLGEGLFPSVVNILIANYIPSFEKSIALSCFTSGAQAAAIFGNPISAWFCKSVFGWEGAHYLAGILLLTWSLVFGLTVKNNPANDKWISDQEKTFLQKHLFVKVKDTISDKHPIPLISILTSPAFLSIIACSIVLNIYIVFIHLFLPLFFKEALYLPVMANGVYSAVPFLFQVVLKMGWSFFVSKLVKENKITLNTSAKLSQFISGITTAIFFFLIPLTLDCTKPYITVLLLAIGTSGFDLLSCGFLVSLLSIAPNHTGLLTSLHTMNGIMARIGAPYLFSLFRTTGTPEDWKNILWLIGGLWLFVSIIFTIFGSVEVQPWNNTSKPNNVNDFKKKGEETLFIEGVNEIVVIT